MPMRASNIALAQVAEDVDAVERLDLGVEIADAQAELVVVAGQVLGHLLGQRRDQDALVAGGPGPDLGHEVIDLAANGPDLELWVGQAGRADDLLDDAARRSLDLVGAGSRRDVEGLADATLELVEVEGPVVEGRGQAEAVLDEGQLARAVAGVHAADLGDGDVGLVDDGQEVLGEVIEERERRFAGRAAGQVAGVVLDAGAVAELAEHLEVVEGPLLDALGLDGLAEGLEAGDLSGELGLDAGHGRAEGFGGRGEERARVDHDRLEGLADFAEQGVDGQEGLDPAVLELDAVGRVLVAREDLDDIAADAEGAALEVALLALVLDGDELLEEGLPADGLAEGEREAHGVVGLRRADPVDAGDRGDDDDVAAGEQGVRGAEAEPVDLVVDRRFLGDVGVRGGDEGLGLVVVVVADEVLDGVAGEEAAELLVELGGQGLVVGDDQDGAVDLGDDIGHREGLARAGDALEDLVARAGGQARREPVDGLDLVALGGEFGL